MEITMDDAMLTGIVLPIASAIAACGAAYFALQPAKIQLQEHAASIVDVPALYILDNRIAISDLSQPNRRAAWLAIVAAVLGAASPLWSLFHHFL